MAQRPDIPDVDLVTDRKMMTENQTNATRRNILIGGTSSLAANALVSGSPGLGAG